MSNEIKASDMLRTTAVNSYNLFQQLADHIDKIEARNQELEEKLLSYGELPGDTDAPK